MTICYKCDRCKNIIDDPIENVRVISYSALDMGEYHKAHICPKCRNLLGKFFAGAELVKP